MVKSREEDQNILQSSVLEDRREFNGENLVAICVLWERNAGKGLEFHY
jgi:hypothetical protein